MTKCRQKHEFFFISLEIVILNIKHFNSKKKAVFIQLVFKNSSIILLKSTIYTLMSWNMENKTFFIKKRIK